MEIPAIAVGYIVLAILIVVVWRMNPDRVLGSWASRKVVLALIDHQGLPLNDAIKHIAYYIPEHKRFSEPELKQILKRLNYVPDDLSTALWALTQEGVLGRDQEWFSWPIRWWFDRYYLTRTARDKYRAELAAISGNPVPQIKAVLERLKNLVANVTEPRRSTFLQETTACLAASAYRATMVMGWNLAYYHVREWILVKHLPAFNRELTSRKRSSTKNYDPVTSHDDFPDSESLVLDVSAAAQIVDKHRRDILEVALKRRNRFAHPGPAVASELDAAGYISDLLENVITSSFFA